MKLIKIFLYSYGILLLITASAKLISAAGHVEVLNVIEPILGLTYRHLFIFAGIAELLLALYCLLGSDIWLQMHFVASLSTALIIYRLGLLIIHYPRPCTCLGTLTDSLSINPHDADVCMQILLAYLVLTSYGWLIWHWRTKRIVINHAIPS